MEEYVKAVLDFHVAKMTLPPSLEGNSELGAWMLITYKIATCEDGSHCRKGDHILESLAARAYNLAVSSTILSATGLYDEALNSVRSLGELANVLAYLTLYPDDYPNWVRANKRSKATRYSPSAIRAAIEQVATFVPPMDKNTYAELCELSTHVHSATSPNAYGSDARRHVGGFRQDVGDEKVAELLTYTMSMVALLVSKMVGRDDLFEEAMTAVRNLPESD